MLKADRIGLVIVVASLLAITAISILLFEHQRELARIYNNFGAAFTDDDKAEKALLEALAVNQDLATGRRLNEDAVALANVEKVNV